VLGPDQLHVAVCQLTSNDNLSQNGRDILRILNTLSESTSSQGPIDLVCFPENALYLRINRGDPRVGITLNDEWLLKIADWAQKNRTHVHLGSVPLVEAGRCFSASLLFTPDGNVTPVYRKIHLFDVDVIGQKPVRESELFSPGSTPSVFEIKGWKIACSICYDIRFSELFNHYARLGVDVILIPSAFLTTTGQAHWEILVRARAIESQAYVLAAAQGGVHRGEKSGERQTHGHSMIVDPWGKILAEVREESGEKPVLKAHLSLEMIRKVRSQIPMAQHRRL